MDATMVLPDEVLPLLAAGSNVIMARLRSVSSRFAAVCEVPLLEIDDWKVARGRNVFDLATKYVDSLDAPVLSCDDICALREIVGDNIRGLGLLMRTPRIYKSARLCSGGVIDVEFFNGVYSGRVNMDLHTRLVVLGQSIHATTIESGREVGYSMSVMSPMYGEKYSIVVDTSLGKVYWAGYRRSVNWFAARVKSVMLTRLC
jgi:hypothetical protein